MTQRNHRATDRRRSSIAPLVIGSLILLLGALPARSAGSGGYPQHVTVLSDSEIRARTGKSVAVWGRQWWRWAFANPDVLGDTTGEFGPLGDVGGPVFFAEGSGGGSVQLNYLVPGGKYLLLPVATYIWTFFDPCADLQCARRIVNTNFIGNTTEVFARIDGVRVRDLSSHLVRVDAWNPPFAIDTGLPAIPGEYGGILPAVQGGYWLMLAPLSPGVHVLNFGATVPALDPDTGEPVGGTFDLDTTLRIYVTRTR